MGQHGPRTRVAVLLGPHHAVDGGSRQSYHCFDVILRGPEGIVINRVDIDTVVHTGMILMLLCCTQDGQEQYSKYRIININSVQTKNKRHFTAGGEGTTPTCYHALLVLKIAGGENLLPGTYQVVCLYELRVGLEIESDDRKKNKNGIFSVAESLRTYESDFTLGICAVPGAAVCTTAVEVPLISDINNFSEGGAIPIIGAANAYQESGPLARMVYLAVGSYCTPMPPTAVDYSYIILCLRNYAINTTAAININTSCCTFNISILHFSLRFGLSCKKSLDETTTSAYFSSFVKTSPHLCHSASVART